MKKFKQCLPASLGFALICFISLESISSEKRLSANSATTQTVVSIVWPMSGHDPQRSGLSSFVGLEIAPTSPSWTYTTSASVIGDIAVSAEGNIYFASDKLYALEPDGTLLVPAVSMSAVTSPAIDDHNGYVYIGQSTSNGWDIVRYTKQLQFPIVIFSGTGSLSPLIIGENGAVYFQYKRFPGLVTAAGPVNWTVALCPGESGTVPGSPVPNAPIIGRDGSVYAICPEAFLFKLDGQTGQTLASTGVGRNEVEPMMDMQNHIWSGNQAFGGAIFFGSFVSWDSNLNVVSVDESASFTSFTTARVTMLPDGSTVRRGYTSFPDAVLSFRGAHTWDVELPNPRHGTVHFAANSRRGRKYFYR